MLFFTMKLLAIIAEYNPFHQGHQYHLKKAKEETGATHTLIIMGGNFLQRGDVAIEDKFIRAQKALQGGADLVVELPFIYASSWAREFARGGVLICNALPFPVTLSFGSESGDLAYLENLLSQIQNVPRDNRLNYGSLLRQNLSEHPGGANDVLGLEYLRALKQTHSPHLPHTLKRIGQAYHSDDPHCFPSASSLRRRVEEGTLPHPHPLFLEDFRPFIYGALLTKELSSTYGMIEGLENRLQSLLSPERSLREYVERASTKRYRPARIRRLLIHHLLGYTKKDYALLQDVTYIKPLAYTKKGTQILRELKNASVDVLHPLNPPEDLRIRRALELDLLASKVYNFVGKTRAQDYKRDLLIHE